MTDKIKKIWDGTLDWTERKLPPGLRLVVGLLLMVFGVFGFMPIFGFWMLPLGVAVAALDVKPLIRRFRRKSHS